MPSSIAARGGVQAVVDEILEARLSVIYNSQMIEVRQSPFLVNGSTTSRIDARRSALPSGLCACSLA
jgi:hypothetical protein